MARRNGLVRLAQMQTLLCLLIGSTCGATVTPHVFAPGVVSGSTHEAAPAFTPDGNTVYFQRSTAAASTILVSHRLGVETWSKPQIAAFSGAWNDLEPAMAPDGSFIVFISSRPASEGGRPLAGFYNGQRQPGGNLWRVERRGKGWSDPIRLPDTVNRSTNIFAPAVTGDGSIYFMEPFGEKARFRLYRSQYRGGTYQPPQPVAFSDGTYTDVDPAVAPDESFMIFGSSRPPAMKSIDLFIVRRVGARWGTPIHLGSEVNSPGSDAEPRLSPDQRTLYFSSERVLSVTFPRDLVQAQKDLQRIQTWDNGQYNIWRVPLAQWLDEHRGYLFDRAR